jgi:hypothetical protein
MVMALLYGHSAAAQDCEVRTRDAFARVVKRAEQALWEANRADVDEALVDLRQLVRCMDDRADGPTWARFLYVLVRAQYAKKESWEDTLRLALYADPSLDRSQGAPPVRRATPEDVEATIELAPSVRDRVFVDGYATPERIHLVGPRLIQVLERGVWYGEILRGSMSDAMADRLDLPRASAAVDDTPTSRPGPDLGLHLALGSDVWGGVARTDDVGVEPSWKVLLLVEYGLGITAERYWLRLVGRLDALTNGDLLWQRADGVVASRIGAGVHLAGGARIARGRVGALAGITFPARANLRAVGGYDLLRDGWLALEVRAGINVASVVEPAFGLRLQVQPTLRTITGRRR